MQIHVFRSRLYYWHKYCDKGRWPPMKISEDIDTFYDVLRQTFYISSPYQRNDAMNPVRTLNTSNNILDPRSYWLWSHSLLPYCWLYRFSLLLEFQFYSRNIIEYGFWEHCLVSTKGKFCLAGQFLRQENNNITATPWCVAMLCEPVSWNPPTSSHLFIIIQCYPQFCCMYTILVSVTWYSSW